MQKNFSPFWKRFYHPKPPTQINQSSLGMSMIELLVGTVIAFIIITPLMAFVVNTLNDDQREEAKAVTDKEIQSALEFITEDLSEALYIYDKAGIQAIATNQLIPAKSATQIPILVFWKRQVVRNILPIGDDTFILSLVAYYLRTDADPIWCPNNTDDEKCPARITRFQLKGGGRTIAGVPFPLPDPGFPTSVDLRNPNTITPSAAINNPQNVLINFIDRTTIADGAPGLVAAQCTTALNNSPTAAFTVVVNPVDPDSYTSFSACVDSPNNIAQITIRGNALRRFQENATYSSGSAYFPSSSILVKGIGTVGN
ncbi:hormogonium polysaccharide secretion pseudopilin HpsC [Planktothrix agardhii]|uniref:hormogonium polysaccharide secretion pseudopilin HpsC n=1 Tax=Planktothrix agardhii TaxID=1160 RepID=UPI001D0B4383|nr:hormogonium polysaccharide secretion pseudopilin HpsC [Planktothrix agardhii]MCB8749129.1 hormogonium polysaccharide secretion pseudopilin HpsC [Planktothrix agardhii 1810]MCF3605166.1 hormogonium polysaccharide secretion pseudopilin HpsC [Planktothrix agardhii 1033]